jgi:osmotically-inducible protein OsmY
MFTMRDSEIEQWVLNEIGLTAGGRLKEVCVLSLTGIVRLNGSVDSRADRLAAHEAAARAKGVVGVINRLNVRKRNSIRRRAVVTTQVASAFHLPTQKNLGSSQVAN